ncbi:MAG: dienelactone hydrolase family protein [Rhodobacteraceae bacterium]|nr:dienelactone hydrolase family protein [Paracoccaceae bacterium]
MFETLTAADGHAFQCWMQPAEGEVRGGLVILQEIFGVTDQLKGVARRYASQGLNVAIPALFDRQAPGTVVPFAEAPKGRDLMLAASLEANMADTAAAVAALKARGSRKVAVLGFCWGGGLAVRAAQVLDVACAVSFYGTRLPTYLDRPLVHPVQGHFGLSDDHTPPAVVEQVKAALPGFEIFLYEAGHAFANDARAPVYVPEAAEQAHARTAGFLAEHLA